MRTISSAFFPPSFFFSHFLFLAPLLLLQASPVLGEESPAAASSSWEKTPASLAQSTTPALPAAVVATGELADGEKLEITEVKRTSGDTVTLKLKITNTGSDELNLGTLGDGDWYNWNLAKVFLLDLPNKKKYFVLRDSEEQPLTSKGKTKLKPGAQISLWAKFPAPPSGVEKITVEVPSAAPFEDLPIAR